MPKIYVFEGKTTNEAIEKGLKELKISKREAEIKVLDQEDKRSFFSILTPRVVKVEFTIKEDKGSKEKVRQSKEIQIEPKDLQKAKENLEQFIKGFLEKLPSKELQYKIQIEENALFLEIIGEDINYLIGYRGETLSALQTILSTIASKGIEHRIRVIVDIYGYRAKREKALKDLANKLAKTVIKTRKEVKLEPMSAYERKIIHEELQNHPKVITKSVGEEPNRRVIISLK